MNRLFQHELVKLFLFIFISFIGAAFLAPPLYSWGKDLAAEAAISELSAPMEWLANKCERAKFSRYFNRALMATALVLLFPLIKSLRNKGSVEIKAPLSQRLNPHAQGWKDLAMGLLLSITFLTLLSVLLFQLNWLTLDPSFDLGKAIQKAIIPAIIVSLLEEWLFRGVLYSVLMRRLSSTKTIIGLSLFFAAVHFLSPPAGSSVANPHDSMAGFEMLRLIGLKFLSASSFFGVFLTLFVVGLTLAYTRYKTGKLWMAIGLHAGWIFSLKFVNKATDATGLAPDLMFNDNITDGLLPLLALILTGASVALYLKPHKL